MANTILYPGIAFSPQALLADNIGGADTIIPVSDISAFPDAPNLATIGTDEEGETVMYAAKTDTALSGCVRGVEGAARSWRAGEVIGRNFTAKDHADLIAAILETKAEAGNAQEAAVGAQETAASASAGLTAHAESPSAHPDIWGELAGKQGKLTGQPGQVVSFDGMGFAYAVQGWSNRNLLDNWYFADPINQRGNTEYLTVGYSIDRWTMNGVNVEIAESYIICSSVNTASTFFQRMPMNLLGQTVTVSALLYNNTLISYTAVVTASLTSDANLFVQQVEDEMFVCGFLIPTLGVNLNIIAVKLELGDHQTLAHQDADGNWVLNDPPPNKALELAKCQRYYQRLTQNIECCCYWIEYNIVYISGFPFLNTMRTTPTISCRITDLYNNTHTVVSQLITRSGVANIGLEGFEGMEIGKWFIVSDIKVSADL